MARDLSRAVWRVSTRTGGNGNCVEVADNLDEIVAVRDSKDRPGPVLVIGAAHWVTFVDGIKAGGFNLP